MKIYGLSGKSGTGKSYNAIELCRRLDIPALIDDGLFIFENNVKAGISAKKQATKVGAIKTALFTDNAHALAVQEAIIKCRPSGILILGTSDRMVDQIAQRLGLAAVQDHIHIEDITTKDQREKAKEQRDKAGMHTIPAPTFQLKKQFSGYLLDATKSFKRTQKEEKTIVRPSYSYLGAYDISERVISDIAGHIVKTTAGAAQMLFTTSSNTDEGIYIRVIILCEWGAAIRSTALEIQKKIHETVSMMTAFNVLGVEVEIRGYK